MSTGNVSLTRKPRTRRAARAGSRMEDVAQLAGVSLITVSRVLNTPDKVAPATRRKIEAAIRKTGYLPNLTAGSLASNRSRIIAAIVPTIDNSIFAETVRGLSETLAAGGYQLLLGQTGYDEKTEEALVAAFLGRHADGMVLTGGQHSKLTVKRLKAAHLPVVEIWDLPAAPIDMVAGFSNLAAGRAMARHLLARGYRRLGFAGGDDDRTDARLRGFAAALRQVRGTHLVHASLGAGRSFGGGREALTQLLAQDARLDAIFFSNDALAAGALMECQRRGIQVPQQLAIAGFADLDFAAEIEPALTTVKVRSRHIGDEAAHMLLTRLAGETVTTPVRDVGFTVVERAST